MTTFQKRLEVRRAYTCNTAPTPHSSNHAFSMDPQVLLAFCLLCLSLGMNDQEEIDPKDYRIEKKDLNRALNLINTPLKEEVVFPNPAAGAQWFPNAGLGLFMHWGMHSVDGVQPAWNMIQHCRYEGRDPHTVKQ